MTDKVYKGVRFELSASEQKPAVFVLGVRKSGSSILNSMVTALAESQGMPFIDVAGKLFAAGVKVVDWQNDAAMAGLIAPGNVYGGFRNCPTGLLGEPLYLACKKVLLVRDPRDALVSEYFSNAYSHSLPKEGEGREQMMALRQEALQASLESFVVDRCGPMRKTLMEFAPMLKDPSLKVFKYEAVIGAKRQLLHDICRHFNWQVSEQHITNILSWADVMPDEERPTEFVRRVSPGDHIDKLSPATIARLNELLRQPMDLLGYV